VSREFVRALTAEAIGTFALVFAGCGAIMVDAKTHQVGHVGVSARDSETRLGRHR
jgi:glycerol uptake facilitator-like aquaporin